VRASLRQGLTRWLLPSLFIALTIGAICAYLVAQYAAALAYDEALMAAAEDFALGVHAAPDGLHFALTSQGAAILANDARDHIYFAVRTKSGQLIGGDSNLQMAPVVRLDHGGSILTRVDGIPVHALSMQFDQFLEPVVITVAETLNKRGDMTRSVVLFLLLPAFLALVLAGLLVWFAVGRGLAPLESLKNHIEARSARDLSPIALTSVPDEVRLLVQSFNQLLRRLEESAQAQQNFIADVAHQLRTPLAGVQALAELLPTLGPVEGKATLERLRATAARAIRLANQLLLLSRSNQDLIKPSIEPLDLKSLVEEVADDWVHRAIALDIDFGFELAQAEVLGDAFLLREMMDNVVDNALRYSGRGKTVTVTTRLEHDEAIFCVEDAGPGIPPEYRERVLGRFFRMPESSGEGSGLGLAIVAEILSLHGGRVEIAQSRLGGALIRLCLPRLPTSAATSA